MNRMNLRAFLLLPTMVLSLLSLAPLLVQAQTVDAVSLTVRVVDARNAKGIVRVALFRSADGFPGDSSKALHLQRVQIDSKTLTGVAVFANIPAGTYAISLFHDENMNGKLDKNFAGIPKEGYGASNNPPRRMHPPTFDEANFVLGKDQTVEIKLLY